MRERRVARLAFALAPIAFALSVCRPAAAAPTSASATAAPRTQTPIPATATPTFAVATQRLPTFEPQGVPWVVPSRQTPFPVTKAVDLAYSGNQRLDVYAPAATGRWPVVVVLHGGGDTKEFMRDLAEAIAGRGAVVFTPTFGSSAPTVGSGSAANPGRGADQVACAVRFARAHAGQYGGNGTRVMLVGYSAGAGLGALMLLAGDDFHGDCLTPEGSALPDAFVGLDGGYDLLPFVPEEELRARPSEWGRISPFNWINRRPVRTGVPILLLVGNFTVARQQSQAFRDSLQSAGYVVWLESVPGVDHIGMASPLPQTVGDIHDLLGP